MQRFGSVTVSVSARVRFPLLLRALTTQLITHTTTTHLWVWLEQRKCNKGSDFQGESEETLRKKKKEAALENSEHSPALCLSLS